MNTELIAEIYRGGGEIFWEPHEPLKPPIEAYKDLLRQAGKEVASELKLSPQTMDALEKPLLPDELYIKGAKIRWDKQLAKYAHKT